MKRRRNIAKKDGLRTKTFYIRCMLCLALFLAACAVRVFGHADFYDDLLYRLGEGPGFDEVVETLGRAPVEREAFVYLWKSAVEQPVVNIFSFIP